MANVLVSEDTMKDIADSIREKTKKQGLLKPAQMPAEIESISGEGGGGDTPDPDKPVRFYDYDGTLVYSYTQEEIQELEELPPLPEHPGLIGVDWNWWIMILQRLPAEVNVGALYTTDDGATRLHIHLVEGKQSPTVSYTQTGAKESTIDWGDGTEPALLSGASVSEKHVYESPGNYVISIYPGSKTTIQFTGDWNTGGYLLGKKSGNLRDHYYLNLTGIELGDNIAIGDFAFSGYKNVEKLNMPNLSADIGNRAFQNMESLRCLVLPNVDYGSQMVAYTTALELICFSDGMTSIPASLFEYAYGIQKLCLHRATFSIGENAFYKMTGLKELRLPRDLRAIPAQMALGCESLTDVEIPENVTTIGRNAFGSMVSMGVIKIPSKVTTIDEYAFYQSSITKFYVYPLVPPTIKATSFQYLLPEARIFVPAESLEDYKEANIWSTFADQIVPMEE